MAGLTVPVVCTVIGEGGSGGALAIGVGDRVNMLQYSTYSVISPEGCASILWKSADKASVAAEAMGITAQRLKELKLIDHVIRRAPRRCPPRCGEDGQKPQGPHQAGSGRTASARYRATAGAALPASAGLRLLLSAAVTPEYSGPRHQRGFFIADYLSCGDCPNAP